MSEVRILVVLILCPMAWVLLDLLRKVLAARARAMPMACLMVLGQLPFLLIWLGFEGGVEISPGYFPPALLSVAINLVANVAYMRAIRLSPMGATLPLLSLTPAFSSLFGVPLLGEVPELRQWLGIVFVVGGAILLNSMPGERSLLAALRRERGAPWMILVALLWSLTPAFDKMALRHASETSHALVLTLGIACGLLIILLCQDRLVELRVERRALAWLTLAAFVGAAASLLQLLAIRWVWVGLVETLKRGIGAAFALLLGWWLFGEQMTRRRVWAVVLMVFGVVAVLV